MGGIIVAYGKGIGVRWCGGDALPGSSPDRILSVATILIDLKTGGVTFVAKRATVRVTRFYNFVLLTKLNLFFITTI